MGAEEGDLPSFRCSYFVLFISYPRFNVSRITQFI